MGHKTCYQTICRSFDLNWLNLRNLQLVDFFSAPSLLGQVTDQRPAENTPLPYIWRRNPRCRPSGVSCGRLESHNGMILWKFICKHRSEACSFRQHVLRVHNKNECIIVHVFLYIDLIRCTLHICKSRDIDILMIIVFVIISDWYHSFPNKTQ